MTNTSARTLAAVAFVVSALVGGHAPAAIAYVDTSICAASPEVAGPDCGAVGDDNGDGYVMEDESGWDCATMGNRICGPVVGGVKR